MCCCTNRESRPSSLGGAVPPGLGLSSPRPEAPDDVRALEPAAPVNEQAGPSREASFRKPRRLSSFSAQQLCSAHHEVLQDTDSDVALPSRASSRILAERDSEGKKERPEVGDVVELGTGTPPEFAGHYGVVTATGDAFVTVAVLDPSGCIGVGECWPSLGDVSLVHQDWRLGGRVVIDGFKGGRAGKLNGSSGTVTRHPHSGHPSFVCKPHAPDEPRLTLCVRLDNPAPSGGKASVLVEPRFLQPYGAFVREAAAAVQREAGAEA